jgi:hypothetical protein
LTINFDFPAILQPVQAAAGLADGFGGASASFIWCGSLGIAGMFPDETEN